MRNRKFNIKYCALNFVQFQFYIVSSILKISETWQPIFTNLGKKFVLREIYQVKCSIAVKLTTFRSSIIKM